MSNHALPPVALLPGTLELLVLSVLIAGPAHGYAVARAIERASGMAIAIEEGSLYPCLQRLARGGMVEAAWGLGATGRRVRVYTISGSGRRRWAQQHRLWLRSSAAIDAVVAAHT
jgi:transcriptional regulator